MWDPDTDLSWENVRRIYPYAPEALGEQHLLEFRAIAKQHNEPLREAALQRSAMLADALAFKWATNDIVKGPFTFVAGCKPVGRRSVMATTCCSKTGWAVAASVYSDELPPEYEAVANSVTKMAAERDKALGTYIKSLQ
jgi:hypothetical protein